MLNRGVSFGLWPGISIFTIGFVLVGLVVYAVKVRELNIKVSLLMMVSGGAGNLYERIVYGGVRDNLNFFGLFYNNVWDYLIVGGVVLFIIHLVRRKI